jgi:hypothetical protein
LSNFCRERSEFWPHSCPLSFGVDETPQVAYSDLELSATVLSGLADDFLAHAVVLFAGRSVHAITNSV